MSTINVDVNTILNAAKQSAYHRSILQDLFPKLFEDEKQFSRIGVLMTRKTHPHNFYTLFKWNGEVRILNITQNTMWKSERNIKVSDLKHPDYITRGEFQRMLGDVANVNDFATIRMINIDSVL